MSEYMKQMIIGNTMVFLFSVVIYICDIDIKYILIYAILWIVILMIVAVFIDNGYLFKD